MDVEAGRYTANYPDDFVVFCIGMRINQLGRANEWVPVMRTDGRDAVARSPATASGTEATPSTTPRTTNA